MVLSRRFFATQGVLLVMKTLEDEPYVAIKAYKCTVSEIWRDFFASAYRVAAFDVTGRKTTETPSVILRFSHKTAWQESSNFYSDLRNANSSELTKYYCVNCRCSAVTMPIRSSSYATSSTSELVVSVQLPLNTMLFCHAEVLSHVFFWRHSTSMQPLYIACTSYPYIQSLQTL